MISDKEIDDWLNGEASKDETVEPPFSCPTQAELQRAWDTIQDYYDVLPYEIKTACTRLAKMAGFIPEEDEQSEKQA